MSIEIIDYKPMTPRDGKASYLKGFLRLKIKTEWGWLTCNEMQVYSKNGQHWVSFPSKKVEGPEGIKYHNYSYFERADSDKFSEAVIKALKTWNLAKQGGSTDPSKITQPSESNGPKKGIGNPVQSMDPSFTSAQTGETLPF